MYQTVPLLRARARVKQERRVWTVGTYSTEFQRAKSNYYVRNVPRLHTQMAINEDIEAAIAAAGDHERVREGPRRLRIDSDW